jgi:hypothetical protein
MISKITVGTTPVLVSAAKNRSWVRLQNLSDTPIFVSLEGSSDVTVDTGAKPGVRINAGDSLYHPSVRLYQSAALAIYAVSTASGKVLTCQEI